MAKIFHLDKNSTLHFYPSDQVVSAVDIMLCLGLDKETSRQWCNCPFNSRLTFSLPTTSTWDDYVICQTSIKGFLYELAFARFITLAQGTLFMNKLWVAWHAPDNAEIVAECTKST